MTRVGRVLGVNRDKLVSKGKKRERSRWPIRGLTGAHQITAHEMTRGCYFDRDAVLRLQPGKRYARFASGITTDRRSWGGRAAGG